MSRPIQPPKEEKQKVPGYIVTFSDMVTLLLTFFVLLLTLAEMQDPELFNQGRDSFWESIRLCGLGALLGSDMTIDLGEPHTRYLTTDPETSDDRALDEYREKLRRAFERISESAATFPSQLTAHQLRFSIVDVRFGSGQATLNNPARELLSKFCFDLQHNLSANECSLYVLGLAGEEATERQQWTLSARRAHVVADFLEQNLDRPMVDAGANAAADAGDPWKVFWWGAGPGGNWAGQERPNPGKSQILIAVLKTSG